jgi:isopenicillin-N epimerase
MESLTTRFFTLELKELYLQSLAGLASFINAPLENIVFIKNATTAANALISSLSLKEGDEIITTNLIYEACRHLLNHYAQTKGVVLKVAQFPFPVTSDEQVISAITELITPKTKLAFLDHITSETATILPIASLIQEFRKRGIPLFIDGAHAPGMILLDLEKLDPDYYTGNCHKWLCSPKGAAFFYVRPDKQKDLNPAIISNYFRKGNETKERFFNSFYWSGTADYTPYCCVKPVIDFFEQTIEGGWSFIMNRNRQLVLTGRDIICDTLGLNEYTPEEMTGSLVTIRLNSKSDLDEKTGLDILVLKLLYDYKIEALIPRLYQTEERILRISAHLYNKESDYEKLALTLKQLL